MTTKQINIRLSDPGQRLLADLAELYGSQTKAIEVAIDRLHQQECAHKCQRCGKPLPLSTSPYWVDEGESVFLCDECADGEGEEVRQMAEQSSTESAPKVKVGETVSYPGKQGETRQGTVATATPNTVLFTDGNWCYTHEVVKSPK